MNEEIAVATFFFRGKSDEVAKLLSRPSYSDILRQKPANVVSPTRSTVVHCTVFHTYVLALLTLFFTMKIRRFYVCGNEMTSLLEYIFIQLVASITDALKNPLSHCFS